MGVLSVFSTRVQRRLMRLNARANRLKFFSTFDEEIRFFKSGSTKTEKYERNSAVLLITDLFSDKSGDVYFHFKFQFNPQNVICL